MVFRFSANLNFLFLENGTNMMERYALAAKSGFKGVENGIPNDVTVENLKKSLTENQLTQVLLNISTDAPEGGQFGCASFPGKESYFQTNLARTIEFAKALSCKKVHLMAGKIEGERTDANEKTYIANLKYAASELDKIGAIGLIEPINKYAVPGYYLNDFSYAIKILNEVNKPNIKLMVDVYHLQHINGNITNFIKEHINYIGHIQIAQVPSRSEPDTPGEVDYPYVFKVIDSVGYEDWIGCEYKPRNDTTSGLQWVKAMDYKL